MKRLKKLFKWKILSISAMKQCADRERELERLMIMMAMRRGSCGTSTGDARPPSTAPWAGGVSGKLHTSSEADTYVDPPFRSFVQDREKCGFGKMPCHMS